MKLNGIAAGAIIMMAITAQKQNTTNPIALTISTKEEIITLIITIFISIIILLIFFKKNKWKITKQTNSSYSWQYIL